MVQHFNLYFQASFLSPAKKKKKTNILARRTRSVELVLRYVLRSRSLTRSPSLLAPPKLARVSYAVACPSLPLSSAAARPPRRKTGSSASLLSGNIFPHASAPDRPHLSFGIRLTPLGVNCTVLTPRKPCILASVNATTLRRKRKSCNSLVEAKP